MDYMVVTNVFYLQFSYFQKGGGQLERSKYFLIWPFLSSLKEKSNLAKDMNSSSLCLDFPFQPYWQFHSLLPDVPA